MGRLPERKVEAKKGKEGRIITPEEGKQGSRKPKDEGRIEAKPRMVEVFASMGFRFSQISEIRVL